MKPSLKERFREVDTIPTPWEEGPGVATRQTRPTRGGRGRVLIVATAAAAAAIALAVVVITREPAPQGDASWLVNAQASCVEQYSPRALENRSFAFEGAITDVQGPADPESPDPAATTTTVTFDVERWFWGGSGLETTRRTYAAGFFSGTPRRLRRRSAPRVG